MGSAVVASGRFHHDQLSGKFQALLSKEIDPRCVIRDAEPPPIGVQKHIQPPLADVDTDKHGG